MQQRHIDRTLYFKEQIQTTQKYVIPFIENHKTINSNTRILEIGCGECGNLPPFLEQGCEVVGVDISAPQIEKAKDYLAEYVESKQLTLYTEDIYNMNGPSGFDIGQFDLIIMRDVIEHIHDQDKFLGHLKYFLRDSGKVFFGFPPWYMPFGGHQQIIRHKIGSKLPYIHLLPNFLYVGILKLFKLSENGIDALLEIKETGISIERFRRIVKKNNYVMDEEKLYFINPNYETKFGLTPREQCKFIAAIPFLRNFFTTCSYSIISIK